MVTSGLSSLASCCSCSTRFLARRSDQRKGRFNAGRRGSGTSRSGSAECRVSPRTAATPAWRWCRRNRSCWTSPPFRSALSTAPARWTYLPPPIKDFDGPAAIKTVIHHQQRVGRAPSCTPAAPNAWPVSDLVELVGRMAGSPNISRNSSSTRMSPVRRTGAVGVDDLRVQSRCPAPACAARRARSPEGCAMS